MYRIIISVLILILVALPGCQPTKSETSKIELWPLLKSDSTVTLLEDGWRKTDKGDAVLIAHWDHTQTFNGKGEKTVYNENLEIWPLFDCHAKKTEGTQTDNGTILLFFKYDNTKNVP